MDLDGEHISIGEEGVESEGGTPVFSEEGGTPVLSDEEFGFVQDEIESKVAGREPALA